MDNMTGPALKRRKMRPNNPITKAKQSSVMVEEKVQEGDPEVTTTVTEKETQKADYKAIRNAQKMEAKKARIEIEKKEAEKKKAEKNKAEKNEIEDSQSTAKKSESKKAQPKEKKKAIKRKETEKTDNKNLEAKKIRIEQNKPARKEAETSKSKSIEPVLSTPTPVQYDSASDSDETDKESTERIQGDEDTVMSEPEDEAVSYQKDTDMTEPAKVVETVENHDPSDADDESEEDDETESEDEKSSKDKNKSKDQVLTTSPPKKGETSLVPIRTSAFVSDSDSEADSHSDSKDAPAKKNAVEIDRKPYFDHLRGNRISFRPKKEYDENLSVAENMKGRLNDLFVPRVSDNDFISDSESETDSGEDYETREYPPWQQKLGLYHNGESDPWPKPRKLGYSDKLRLEKRIKKICKREGITFDEAREIFSSSKRKPYIRFFQKIAKIFPNMSLHALAKQCKLMYHVNRKSTPWTQEEIVKLKELMETVSSSPAELSKYIDRSPKNISDFIYNHLNAPKKTYKRWTPEEDLIIAEAYSKIEKGQPFPAQKIVHLFKEPRTAKQIQRRLQNIRHLIQPDGTITKKRKATLFEELDYLKSLLEQAKEFNLHEESQLDFATDRGFVPPSFYLNVRSTIDGFEKMNIKDILEKLIERQERIIESRRMENLLKE